MLVRDQLITTPDGRVSITWEEDTQCVADMVQERKDTDKGWTQDRSAKLMACIPVHEYYEWEKIAGRGCWDDKNFLSFYKAHRPEYMV